ncbi:MAG: aldolase catalytic domain-containing protein [Lachnospiraceae bacterium]|jgi:4-hydroxy 2-oxovalerate aldolase|uniref:aldolase catalytic domain-containing protein n=1 Tax=Bovifimicola ammoniilytica TaxID=2981720 RepID=UPI00082349A5|nr:aldolase catalytic domain-containing protein [Bovifimicola ammoniilytica]MCU6752221.1 aldolase catalytic domain-containing protein [Bovifimicola ammoniilytica]MDD6293892.1 aldolase catalytic domain-containing protein [Eubacteriales bacterium]MDY2606339.1 aldolase catalytic domain-containing protein [Lachnospiraceae bacterium]SCJ12573.1 4-hydroxy-2-oxovalerate aldolase [uncultured Eubacterium sp.]
MEENKRIMNFRPEIKILDATLRDGGLVNNFYFTDEFVRDLYKANVKAGVDYMEFGYKASKEIFDVDKFGKWKFCNEDDIRDIVGDNVSDLKISIMADVGRCDYKNDIVNRSDSAVDMVRVATYINTMPAAIEMIEDANRKGYETTCNIMAISNANETDIDIALEMLGKSCVDGIYIVDSYGSIYPEQMRVIADKYVEVGEKYGKEIGIHAHNNQQLAFANTIESVSRGVNFLDATMSSMGRGAGNCAMELLLGFLKNPKYNLFPVLQFIEKHIAKLQQEGVVWGYDIPYLLTGRLNQHPSAAIDFTKEKRKDYSEFYQWLLERE